jgi:hypothetical protein
MITKVVQVAATLSSFGLVGVGGPGVFRCAEQTACPHRVNYSRSAARRDYTIGDRGEVAEDRRARPSQRSPQCNLRRYGYGGRTGRRDGAEARADRISGPGDEVGEDAVQAVVHRRQHPVTGTQDLALRSPRDPRGKGHCPVAEEEARFLRIGPVVTSTVAGGSRRGVPSAAPSLIVRFR